MYINWAHHYLPKVFGFFSFVFNPLFIYLSSIEKRNSIGNYRYLLVSFAVFDMLYSAVEMLVPVAIEGVGSAFVVFVTENHLFGDKSLHQLALSFRCSFVAFSYGLLAVHFIYRYVVLFNAQLLERFFRPSGFVAIFIFSAVHGVLWIATCQYFLYGDEEVADYVYTYFKKMYNVDSHNLPMLVSVYYEVSNKTRRRSWAGIVILTVISIYAILLYFILGYKIMKKLSVNSYASQATQRLQRQLFKALAVQTFIPIVISFSPCLIAWYAPAFGVDLGFWNNYFNVIALSAFPVMDPLAIIVLLPNYRNKLFAITTRNKRYIGTSSVSTNVH